MLITKRQLGGVALGSVFTRGWSIELAVRRADVTQPHRAELETDGIADEGMDARILID